MSKDLYLVANWKMNKTAREATDYIETIAEKLEKKTHVYLAVPYTSIAPAAHFAKDTQIVIGAQNMNDCRDGAFTGEIAGLMLKEAGAAFVLLGHSERRHLFGETNEFIHRKVLRALQDDLQPILCIGETVGEWESGETEQALQTQLFSALEGVPKEDASRLMIAYEPVWAIGTGKTATAAHVQQAHAFIRSCLAELFGKVAARGIPLLYGGSVKPSNCGEIAHLQDVNGLLIGGASLDPDTFIEIEQRIKKEKKE